VSISFTQNGWLTFLPLIVFFGLLPSIELLLKPDTYNFTKEEETLELNKKIYTYTLYLMVPVQVGFLLAFLNTIDNSTSTFDLIGRIASMGLMCGVLGINVGHELGHRNNRFDEFLGEILLLTSLNTHFLPYHNAGHHFNVATPHDAATARKNESIFKFWIRSHFSSYLQAWSLENKRVKEARKTYFHYSNRMIVYTFCNIALITFIHFYFGQPTLLYFLASAIVGILLLESVNYIEHYGLLRKKNKFGRYEKVKRIHSWNSDHVLGKTMLFNLSRHSDHHYNGSKHYQILKSLPESPQMPTGYPGMIIIALLPPLWYSIMNKKIKAIEKTT